MRFLHASGRAYDAGDTAEAKRLAVALRVLLHTSRNAHALLGQLGLAELLFFDTAEDVRSDNLLPTFGLVFVEWHVGGGARYVTPPPLTPLPHPVWLVPFSAWWHKTVIAAPSESIRLSRRDLVLTMADQDGGAHVDPSVEEAYHRVSREHVASAVLETPAGAQPLREIERASVRQIAQEVLVTLHSGLRTIPDDLPDPPSEKRVSFVADARTGVTTRTEHLVGDLCPCARGRPYRECHGRPAASP